MITFSVSTQAFYDLNFEYEQLPNDLQEIDNKTYIKLLKAINSGCIVFDNLSISPTKPSPYHTWQDGHWHIDDETQQLIKAEQQSQIWEKIKTLRYDKCRAGCYVKSVDKWFHSDDASRQQYIFMRTLPEIPENTLWKTMDGSFVRMNKTLLDELSLALFNEEQQNYMNAEQHRAKMLQAENPIEYDYSTGWSAAYDD